MRRKSFIQFARLVTTRLFEILQNDFTDLIKHVEAQSPKVNVNLGCISVGSRKMVFVNGEDYELVC